ncbi:MAG: 50S ribosomal protein L6 [Myxococcales bacterium]|nr:50S ribosomal protein L6 [Myxococcales bacterium]
MSEQQQTSKTSRVGKRPVTVPKGVTITLSTGKIQVKGPKGALEKPLPEGVEIKQEGEELNVISNAPGRAAPRLQGLARALISNMVHGCAEGYTRGLELHGTGYRAEVVGKTIVCNLGFSHQKIFSIPEGLSVDIPKDSKGQRITLTGPDKEVVGQSAATLRSYRPPEPYGGKGVRYAGEQIRQKAGKAGK